MGRLARRLQGDGQGRQLTAARRWAGSARAWVARAGSALGGVMVALVLSMSLVIGSAQPAAALSPGPILPVGIGTLAGLGTASGTAATAGAAGGMAVAAPYIVTAGAVVLVAWGTITAAQFAKDQWFTDNPPDNTPSSGSGSCKATYPNGMIWDAPRIYRDANYGWFARGCGTFQKSSWTSAYANIVFYYPDGTFTYQDTSTPGCGPHGGLPTTTCWHYGSRQLSTSTALTIPAGTKVPNIWKVFSCCSGSASGVLLAQGTFEPVLPKQYRLISEGDCVHPGGTLTHVKAESVAFENLAGAPSDYPSVSCPSGSHFVGGRHAVQTTPGSLTVVTSMPTDPALTDPNHPNAGCLANAGGTPCQLAPITSDGATWQPNQNPSTGGSTGPAGCKWGGYTLPASECKPQWDTNTDGKPDTGTETNATPLPSPSPTYQPPVAPEVIPPPMPADGDGSRCWPSGWAAFNPLEWVLKPTMCALSWAFVPSSTSTQTFRTQAATITQRAPFVWFGDAAALSAQARESATGPGCWVMHASIQSLVSNLEVFNTCGDKPPMPIFRTLRPLLSVAVYVAFLSPLAWWAWRQYAPGSQGTA